MADTSLDEVRTMKKYYVLREGHDRCAIGTQLVDDQEIGLDTTPVTGIPLGGDATLLFAAHVRADTVRQLLPVYRSLLKDVAVPPVVKVSFPKGERWVDILFYRLANEKPVVGLRGVGALFTVIGLHHFEALLQYGYIEVAQVKNWLSDNTSGRITRRRG